jgi:phenylacetate-CoA ligase
MKKMFVFLRLYFSNLKNLINSNKVKIKGRNLRQYQLTKINILLQEVLHNNEFYKKFYISNNLNPNFKLNNLDDLKQIPILYKDIFRLNAKNEKFISKNYSISNLEKHNTTGSTGSPITIYSDNFSSNFKSLTLNNIWHKIGNKIYYRELRLWRKKELSGIDKYRYDNGFLLIIDIFDLNGDISKSSTFLSSQLDKIYDFNPNVIRGYTSALYTLSKIININRLTKLKSVISSAESLPELLWNDLEKSFNTKVYNLYGGTEATCIGVSNKENRKLVLSENLYFIEIVDKDGNQSRPYEPGRILITDLHAKAFPLIRYEIGDLAIIDEHFYENSNYQRYLLSVEGRTNDVFTLPNGKMLYSHFWQNYFREKMHFINQFQVIQESINLIHINLSLKSSVTETDLKLLKSELQVNLPELKFIYKFNEEFIFNIGGKFSAITSKVKNDYNILNQ